MSLLCPPELCTGCFVCQTVCPNDAILVALDRKGFNIPKIDSSICTECGLCTKKCPILNKPENDNVKRPRVLAAYHSDITTRLASSSGGAFSALAENMLQQGGVVFGAAWVENLKVEHIYVNSQRALEKIRKSKYVPSDLKTSYSDTKKFLDEGKKVLFSGTPCQIAGLYNFLGKRKENKLITVDFICHGVPSPLIFEKYIRCIEKKYRHKISEVNFRDKRYGVECNLLLRIRLSNGKWKNISWADNSFYRGFILNLYLRNACYHCSFNFVPRIGDFTLADYRGLGDRQKFHLENDRPLGFTGLLVNNERATDFLVNSNLQYEERYFDELAASQPHLKKNTKPDPCMEKFWADFEVHGYSYVSKKYMKMGTRKRFDIGLRKMLRPARYYALGRLYKKIKGTRTV